MLNDLFNQGISLVPGTDTNVNDQTLILFLPYNTFLFFIILFLVFGDRVGSLENSPSGPQTQLCLPNDGIKGVSHHCLVNSAFFKKEFCVKKVLPVKVCV